MDASDQIRPERTAPLRAGAGERAAGGLIACVAIAVLIIAARLEPAAAGHGTHRQIGLPPCSWVVWFDKPCPTCGMTTAFATAGEGRWLESLGVQPAGMLLSIATASAFWLGLHTLATGSRIGALTGWVLRPKPIALMVIGLVGSWVYKIMTWNGF